MTRLAEISQAQIVTYLGRSVLSAIDEDADLEELAMDALGLILSGQRHEGALCTLPSAHCLHGLLSEFADRVQILLKDQPDQTA